MMNRTCRYYLSFGSTKTFLGETEVPSQKDMDDVFPNFHRAIFPKEHLEYIVESIEKGARLIAESNYDGNQVWLLAFSDDDPTYWFGREATLKYFGVEDFKNAS